MLFKWQQLIVDITLLSCKVLLLDCLRVHEYYLPFILHSCHYKIQATEKTRKLMMADDIQEECRRYASIEKVFRIFHLMFCITACLFEMVLIQSCSFKVLAVAPIIWRPVQQLKLVKETLQKEVWRICRKWTSLTLSVVCFAF